MMHDAASSHPLPNGDSAHHPTETSHSINGHPQSQPDDGQDSQINGGPSEDQSATDQESGTPLFKANKKRKFDELHSRSRSTSRAVSPPWKSFAADGPTQFTDNGKRRSGRVNHIPLELQPPSNKRKTRAEHEQDQQTKHSKNLEGSKTRQDSASDAKGGEANFRRRASTLNKSVTAATIDASPTTTSQKPDVKKEEDNEVSPATRHSSRRHAVRVKEEPPTVEATTPAKRKVGRPSNASKLINGGSPDDVRDRRSIISHEAHRQSQPSPKLRLKMPALLLQPRHPEYIPKPSPFPSLNDILVHYDEKEKEQVPVRDNAGYEELERRLVTKPKQTPEELAMAEAQTRLRVLRAAEPGGVLSRERSSLYFPDEQDQPARRYGHSDHLWAHGAFFKYLLDGERKNHMEIAKRAAYACLARWKEKQPKTEEEQQKEADEDFRLIYKQTVRDVQRKWELVAREVENRRLAKWTEEQDLNRDLKMQQMLEDTTKMLDRRKLGFESIDSPATPASDEDDDDDDDVDMMDSDDGGDLESGDEGSVDVEKEDDNMSSSASSDSEGDSLVEADGDDKLSPEALRAKYAAIPDLMNEEQEIHQAEPEKDEQLQPNSLAENVDTDSHEDVDRSHIILDEVDDALLDDEDDESTDMSDDMGSSDEDEASDDDGSNDDQSEVSDEEDVGMLGFLGGKERKRVVEAEAGDKSAKVEDVEMADAEVTIAAPADDIIDEDHSTHLGATTNLNLLSATSQEGDHSSQPTPMDDSTTTHTEAESTTTVDLEEVKAQIMPTLEETQASRSITTRIPTLLRATLREYQHFGLDWLAKLYASRTNGILADEMGLGKTIQTIALLAHLAEEHEIWGPHLIVVPTSVILNWEMEFKKFLPGFKVLSYYGTPEERKEKRKGWANPDKYNVVITSYQLVLKDLLSLKVPEWHYMILDEAHNIKNFQSQRYQAMIRLKTHARLLLTGTPLQNSIQELWSLLTFLTAGQDGQGMGDLDEFTQWFKRPVDEIFVDGKNKLGIEAQEIVNKLHHSLRPYILRRMKSQVEKQLPGKYEHTIFCRLSKRQRQLYDAFLGRTDVKEKLSSGNPISVSQALMALRKVCNHPDLFEERPIVTSFTMRKPWSRAARSVVADFEIKDLLLRRRLFDADVQNVSSLIEQNFNVRSFERYSSYQAKRGRQLMGSNSIRRHLQHQAARLPSKGSLSGSSLAGTIAHQNFLADNARLDKMQSFIALTDRRAPRMPMYGIDLIEHCTVFTGGRLRLPRPKSQISRLDRPAGYGELSVLPSMVQSLEERGSYMKSDVTKFGFVTPNAVAHDILPLMVPQDVTTAIRQINTSPEPDAFHESRVRLSIAFPDKRLLQYDCGKLQQLALLLRDLQSRGSRALIFTQMTSVLDILEQFLNIHGYRYMRLDGSTKIEQRQDMMERFNRDTRIDVFILSSRSGGVGMNLTGADSVIFYDLDWNPQMDKQCQDRAHRIGQTRDVNIYKLVSEHTIEVNILRKSNQKRILDEVVIQEGEFTTDYFNRAEQTEEEYVADDEAGAAVDRVLGLERPADVTKALATAEEAVDIQAARAQQSEAYMDAADFEFEAKRSSRPGTSGAMTPAAVENPNDFIVPVDIDIDMDTEADTDERPHIDNYMLSFVELMIKDIAFVPPVDKSKRGRLDKNGRDRSHRPKKRL